MRIWAQEINRINAVSSKLGLVADPVIEAIARLEFEDGLRTGVLLGGCWCLESISNPSWGWGWSWVGCDCQKDPISDPCLVPRIGGIKLQLLCGVSIEPA